MTIGFAAPEGSLGALLRRRRLELGMTQWQVASLVGCLTHRVCQHERQKFIPLPSTLLGYSIALDIEYERLLSLREAAVCESFYGQLLWSHREIEHGTVAGADGHYSRGEKPCPECTLALRKQSEEKRRARGAEERKPGCGTAAGYRRHIKYYEGPCPDCEEEFERLRDARAHCDPNRTPPCGTRNGYAFHMRYCETPCDPCLRASRDATERHRRVAKLAQRASTS